MTKMHLGKWGRSLAVRIPSALVKRLQLKEGDPIDMAAFEKAVIASADERQAAIDRIRQLRRPLPEGYKFDREEANAR